MMRRVDCRTAWVQLLCCLVLVGCSGAPKPGTVLDEAKQAGRTGESFKQADEEYFHDMDGAIALQPVEVQGRDMWIVWSGGNDRFWDKMTDFTFGAFDLLKIVTSHPSLGYSRANRWQYLGLVNEPCFEPATGPDKNRFGLWLDLRSKDCPPDPFENESKYPGVAIGARVLCLPATEIADRLGAGKVANVVLLGALLEETECLSPETAWAVLQAKVRNPQLLELDRQAL